MGQNYHVFSLTLAHRANLPGPKATGCHLHDPAQAFDGPHFFPGIDKRKPHLLWPAKKIAAFFRISLSSRSRRTSLRRRVSTSMTTGFVLDALNQAICQRCPSETDNLIHHSDRLNPPNIWPLNTQNDWLNPGSTLPLVASAIHNPQTNVHRQDAFGASPVTACPPIACKV
jgi:hypothetical protein